MEQFEIPKSQRNLEQDRQSFLEAVSGIPIKEVPTTFDEQAVQNLTDSLENNKLFILGEMHGVEENADVIYTMFKKFEFRQLALEWESGLQVFAEKFLKSGELDFAAIQNSPDGRITAGHFALLKKLKSEGMLEKLICFDRNSGGGTWDARDAVMAKNILANLSELPTLVVAGYLHTNTRAIYIEDEPEEHHPMGENLKKEIPDVASGRIEYVMGQYQNYGTQDFTGLSEQGKKSGARFYQDEGGLYIFELPEAHAAIVPNPDEGDDLTPEETDQIETTQIEGVIYEIEKLREFAEKLPTIELLLQELEGAVGEGHIYWLDRNGEPLSPHQIINDWEVASQKEAWVDHVESIKRADLDDPIWMTRDGQVFDGIHRLTRAVIEGQSKVKVRIFESLPDSARRDH